MLFAAAATLLGVLIVLRFLPAHGAEADNLPESTSPDDMIQEPGPEPSPNGNAPAERAWSPSPYQSELA